MLDGTLCKLRNYLKGLLYLAAEAETSRQSKARAADRGQMKGLRSLTRVHFSSGPAWQKKVLLTFPAGSFIFFNGNSV